MYKKSCTCAIVCISDYSRLLRISFNRMLSAVRPYFLALSGDSFLESRDIYRRICCIYIIYYTYMYICVWSLLLEKLARFFGWLVWSLEPPCHEGEPSGGAQRYVSGRSMKRPSAAKTWLSWMIPGGWYCWWKKSGQPVEVGSLSHVLEGFIHPRWCRISSINSSDHRLDLVLFFSHRKLCQMVWPRHLTNMWIWNTHETSCSRQDRWQKKRDLYRLIDTTEPTERRSGGGTGKWCIQGI